MARTTHNSFLQENEALFLESGRFQNKPALRAYTEENSAALEMKKQFRVRSTSMQTFFLVRWKWPVCTNESVVRDD